jgi:hypothetical protein
MDAFPSYFAIHHSLFDIRYSFRVAATESLRWNKSSIFLFLFFPQVNVDDRKRGFVDPFSVNGCSRT